MTSKDNKCIVESMLLWESITWKLGERIDRKYISNAEKYIGGKLPKDYVDVVLKYNRAFPSKEEIVVANGRRMAIDHLVDLKNKIQGEYEYTFIQEKGLFPIIADSFGNYICFDYRKTKANPPLVFLDHEEWGSNRITFVCKTFTECMKRFI